MIQKTARGVVFAFWEFCATKSTSLVALSKPLVIAKHVKLVPAALHLGRVKVMSCFHAHCAIKWRELFWRRRHITEHTHVLTIVDESLTALAIRSFVQVVHHFLEIFHVIFAATNAFVNLKTANDKFLLPVVFKSNRVNEMVQTFPQNCVIVFCDNNNFKRHEVSYATIGIIANHDFEIIVLV
ncbi:hypothetical protein MT325_m630R [Paramecium bursaria chlorella virus MT325]|uniref:Uncharacterized protein m630R n=1 Tax=Paramecium bursaria Chlorella virus MT325 TaxID=346932 RepID=A7IV10_PBCVM|nr:hypothetical protein MT325_m630R [Paramecium bursaria chlorella virus MT325]